MLQPTVTEEEREIVGIRIIIFLLMHCMATVPAALLVLLAVIAAGGARWRCRYY